MPILKDSCHLRSCKMLGIRLLALPVFSHLNLKATPQDRHSFLNTLKFEKVKSVFGHSAGK